VARHRHTVNVRADGLQAVLGPLLRDRRVVTAVLVDVGSGMVLDAWSSHLGRAELEVLGAGHAELVRTARGGPVPVPDLPGCEVVVSHGDGWHHVVRTVPDPHGDDLALAVVVAGGRRVLERARRRLRVVSTPALTAGPTMSRRPGAPAPPGPVPVPSGRDAGPVGPAGGRPPAPPRPVGPDPAVSGPSRAGREDPALFSLGGAFRQDAARVADVGGDVLPLRPSPVLRAVPPAAESHPDRPRAPLSALAPGPRRGHPG
jgi:hypothetical protein